MMSPALWSWPANIPPIMTKSAPAPVISKGTHKKAAKEEGESQSKNTVISRNNSQHLIVWHRVPSCNGHSKLGRKALLKNWHRLNCISLVLYMERNLFCHNDKDTDYSTLPHSLLFSNSVSTLYFITVSEHDSLLTVTAAIWSPKHKAGTCWAPCCTEKLMAPTSRAFQASDE